MAQAIGLDFGTSNSAVSILDDNGTARLARFPRGSDWFETSPSVLYFDPPPRHTPGSGRVHAGHDAIAGYIEAETKGRFIQSLKSYLADPHFDGTTVGRRKHSLEDLIAMIVRPLRDDARGTFGALPHRVVVGRPVMFSQAGNEKDNAFAIARLRRALAAAGFEDVTFQYEPVAAAHAYERRLDADEIVLVADFGGGTSDFTLIEVGPGARKRPDRTVIGTAGVAIAGDFFDRQIVRHIVAPHLGAGTHYVSSLGKTLPVPTWPYAHLERWHHLSFLRTVDTLDKLERIAPTAVPRGRIEGLIQLVEDDLGFELHRAVQRTKVALSSEETTTFRFSVGGVRITRPVARSEFNGWIAEDLASIAASVDGLIEDTSLGASGVDRVFLTGGSSFVPAVRQIFFDRFGAERVTGGDEMTSVALGLALGAAEH